ncbi:unnamed protein product [Durusdinium trenchii]|uniref:PPM-type phosphatase domain-containing protein n=1 Tax=Durusdinium trenchii TaxID=1381693 RepID=A0ABP0RWG1_9DINO
MIDGGDSEQASLTEGSVAATPDVQNANSVVPASSPSVGLSARSISSVDSPLQPPSMDGKKQAKPLTSSPQPRIRESRGSSVPRRRASGLARPPLEGRWLQQVEACNGMLERPSSAASSVRGSPGSTRSDHLQNSRAARSGQSVSQTNRRSQTRLEASRIKSNTCDVLEEEVLSIMSILQRPRDLANWNETCVHEAGVRTASRSSRSSTTPRRSSPPPRDPYLRTAERAVARVTSDSQSLGHVPLSERARQASTSATRKARPKTSQTASRALRLGASASLSELPALSDSSVLQGSGRMDGLLRLSRAISEAQQALEIQTAEALRRPHESSCEETKALEAFAEKLQWQLAQAQSTSRALEEHLATAKRYADSTKLEKPQEPQLLWRNGSSFAPAPIPEEVDEIDLEKSRSHQADSVESPEVEASSVPSAPAEIGPVSDAPYVNGTISAKVAEAEAAEVAPVAEDKVDTTTLHPEELKGVEPMQSPESGLDDTHRSSPMEQNGERPGNAKDEGQSEHEWEFVVQGHTSMEEIPEHEDTDRKTISCFPSNAVTKLVKNGVACVCARGHRVDPRVPNQDDLVLAMCSWGSQGRVALYGVFDGHGPAGHRCAALARGFLPERIFGDPDLLSHPQEVLKAAFREAQSEMLRLEPTESFSSGTTATVSVVLEQGVSGIERKWPTAEPTITVHTAHVGDSRAILARLADGANGGKCFIVKELTKDHRPDDETEAQRVKDAGGHIRLAGGKRARVICDSVPGHPGFALTRSLGLSIGQECGIIAEPQVSSQHLPGEAEALLILGTDGLFEFCGNRTVAGHLLKHGVTDRALEEVVHESMELWKNNSSNGTVDDATAIAASLGRLVKRKSGSSLRS